MNQKKFINHVKKLDYDVEERFESLAITRDQQDVIIIYNTEYSLTVERSNLVTEPLYDLCVDYAKTPVEVRES